MGYFVANKKFFFCRRRSRQATCLHKLFFCKNTQNLRLVLKFFSSLIAANLANFFFSIQILNPFIYHQPTLYVRKQNKKALTHTFKKKIFFFFIVSLCFINLFYISNFH